MKYKLTSVKQLAYKTVFIYSFFSSLWIIISDTVLKMITNSPNFSTNIQTIKGWAFVLVTSCFLYALIRQGLHSLQESYHLLDAIIEGTTDAIFVKDIQGRYIMVNTTTAQILQKSKSEIIGKDDRELMSPELAHKIMGNDRLVIATGQTQPLKKLWEYLMISSDFTWQQNIFAATKVGRLSA